MRQRELLNCWILVASSKYPMPQKLKTHQTHRTHCHSALRPPAAAALSPWAVAARHAAVQSSEAVCKWQHEEKTVWRHPCTREWPSTSQAWVLLPCSVAAKDFTLTYLSPKLDQKCVSFKRPNHFLPPFSPRICSQWSHSLVVASTPSALADTSTRD